MIAGHEPYEELMKDVKCPSCLRNNLSDIWEELNPDSPYAVIREVIASLSSSEEGKDDGEVLYDTIYRYLVLFGTPTEFDTEGYDMPWRQNRVWNCLIDCLYGDSGRLPSKAHHRRKLKSTCEFEFRRDSALWNFSYGNHAVIIRCFDK